MKTILKLCVACVFALPAWADYSSVGGSMVPRGQSVPLGDFLWMSNYYYGAKATLAGPDSVRIVGRNGSVTIPFAKAPAKVQAALAGERKGLMEVAGAAVKREAQVKWRRENGLDYLGGKVTQVLETGILVEHNANQRLFYVAGKFAGVADGDTVTLNVKRNGEFSYVTVLGAKSTIPSMVHTALPPELK